jgi:hypothetical protein
MTNTFGQSKAGENEASAKNKDLNPPENSSVTGDSAEVGDKQGDTAWRPTDSAVESPTSSEFDDSEAKKRDHNIKSETPGLKPDIAE